MTGHRTDAQKLSDAIGRIREIARYQEEGREPLVVKTSHGDTGLRYIIVQENEEMLVLTPTELRWLVYGAFGNDDPTPAWRYWLANLRWRIGTLCDRARDAYSQPGSET